MTVDDILQALKTKLAEIHDLKRAAAVLEWDQQVFMPVGGAEARAHQAAILQETAHRWFVADEIGAALDSLRAAASNWDYDSNDASLIRVVSRDYEKARKLPPELVAEMARTTAHAYQSWVKAREDVDFSLFRPDLEHLVDLNIRWAEALGYEDSIYDPLLDQFEPEAKTRQVAALFAQLKAGLVPLVAEISNRLEAVDDSVLHRRAEPETQWAFGLQLITDLGFDFSHGRQDKSVHPFTTSFSIGDVRLTTRIDPDYFPVAMYGSLHECGHGLYEQGVSPDLERTPLGDGASMGIHESQSRLWENLVGRSRAFAEHYAPKLRKAFPDVLGDLDGDTYYRAINRVEPSFIRTEADEVTYNLHVMLRFELENEMLEGKVAVADLPDAWNAKMRDYLGVVPPNDVLGVLQDIHWSGGTFGYFPTYTLGNVMSVLFYDHAKAEMPDLEDRIASGDFAGLREWLTSHIYCHGRKYTPSELVRRVTGKELIVDNYLRYIETKFSGIYGL